jgi:hypothetical protein
MNQNHLMVKPTDTSPDGRGFPPTRWGRKGHTVYRFKDTPFGDVVLNDFIKTGPANFAVVMTIWNSLARGEEMSVTWWNCHVDDALTYFGIQPLEQQMWGVT